MVPKYHERHKRCIEKYGILFPTLNSAVRLKECMPILIRTWKRPKGKHNLWFPKDYTGQPLGSKIRPRGRCQRILNLRTFEPKSLIEGIRNRF